MERTLISREECKNIQMGILDVITKVCEQHGWKCYLAYGTLLGAVRHKGYIPWDDDIDLYMSRSDYSELVAWMKKEKYEESDWLKILDMDTEGYYFPYAKAVNCRTEAIMDTNLTKHGVWIDIFPVDNVPDNKALGNLFCLCCKVLRETNVAMTMNFESRKIRKRFRKRIASWIACAVGKRRMARFYDRVCQTYSNKHTEHAACLSGAYGKRERMPKSVLFVPTKLSFEGKSYTGTAEYDAYLKTMYGDYMQLPAEEKRITHDVTAYYK